MHRVLRIRAEARDAAVPARLRARSESVASSRGTQ
jgi:hypothetical protein